jgi:hypothetical protein
MRRADPPRISQAPNAAAWINRYTRSNFMAADTQPQLCSFV